MSYEVLLMHHKWGSYMVEVGGKELGAGWRRWKSIWLRLDIQSFSAARWQFSARRLRVILYDWWRCGENGLLRNLDLVSVAAISGNVDF